MCKIKKLTENVFVASQLEVSDIDEIAAEGITRIICNRPDGEAADQANFETIAEAAKEKGIETVYLPVANPQSITTELVNDFASAANGDEKTLAYCRTGTRSTWVWAYSQLPSRPTAEIIDIAASADYNLSALANNA